MENFNTRLTLIRKISKDQDEKLWEEFVHYYRRYLYVVVRNMNIKHHDAEEVVQVVMFKVWDKLSDFQYEPTKGKFRYWLCAIARNCVIDFIRRQQSQNRRENGLSEKEKLNELNNISIPEIEAIAEKEWQNYIANLALETTKKLFSEKVIDCFILHTQGKSIAEIALLTELSENSVYVYKARVQEQLLKEVKRLEFELD